jgi:hypothetical protein
VEIKVVAQKKKIVEKNNFIEHASSEHFRFLVLLCVVLLTTVCTACKPRGESKSLKEVLAESSRLYLEAFDGEPLPERVSSRLPILSKSLQQLAYEKTPADRSKLAESVINDLRALVVSAGYTTRPALGELIDQFGAVAAPEGQGNTNAESVSLLVSRTFFLLASELKGVRFQLGDRETRK